MNIRKIIMLGLALFIGVATFLVFRSSVQPHQEGAAPVISVTEVLAASHDIPMGTILKESDMKWIPWAESAQNSRLYIKGQTDITTLVGAVVREGLRTDEPVLAGRVVQPHEQGFLAAVLTPGMRAVSISLTPSTGVAGFIFPGDHVDVILTHGFTIKNDKNETDSTERRLSETIIENARVLALDQKSDDQSTDPKVAQLATLEVTPKQAEKLTLASDMVGQITAGKGSLSLVLRSLAADDVSTGTPNADHAPTMDSDLSPVFPHVNHLQKVEVMRGKETTETLFQKLR